MARSAQKRRAQRPAQQPTPKPRKVERPAYEQQMFFPRLRNQAKWMFVFLALVFGVGFIAFGVGSNISGTGFGDILQGRGGGSSGGPSVGDAREKVEDKPNDPAARKDLAEALETDGRRDEAITAYEEYLRLRPKDGDAIRRVAGLYMTRANTLRNEYARLYGEYQTRTGGGLFGPPQDSEFGRALGGKIDQELQTIYTRQLTDTNEKMQAAFGRAATLYAQVVATHPDDEALLQLQIGDAAFQARRIPMAVKAYEGFVKLAPDDPNAAYARQQIAALKAGAGNVQPG